MKLRDLELSGISVRIKRHPPVYLGTHGFEQLLIVMGNVQLRMRQLCPVWCWGEVWLGGFPSNQTLGRSKAFCADLSWNAGAPTNGCESRYYDMHRHIWSWHWSSRPNPGSTGVLCVTLWNCFWPGNNSPEGTRLCDWLEVVQFLLQRLFFTGQVPSPVFVVAWQIMWVQNSTAEEELFSLFCVCAWWRKKWPHWGFFSFVTNRFQQSSLCCLRSLVIFSVSVFFSLSFSFLLLPLSLSLSLSLCVCVSRSLSPPLFMNQLALLCSQDKSHAQAKNYLRAQNCFLPCTDSFTRLWTFCKKYILI